MELMPRRECVCQGRGGTASTSRVEVRATRLSGLPALPNTAYRERAGPAAVKGWEGAREPSGSRRGRYGGWQHGNGAAGSGDGRRRSWHTGAPDGQRRSPGEVVPTLAQGRAADLGRTLVPRHGGDDRAGPGRAGRARSASHSPSAGLRYARAHKHGDVSNGVPEPARNQAAASSNSPAQAAALRADIVRLTAAVGIPHAMK